MRGMVTQFFSLSPTFIEKSVPSLVGKVFIVTGGNAGVGLELVKILYSKGGTVYIASCSPSKIAIEIEAIKSIHTASPGYIKGLPFAGNWLLASEFDKRICNDGIVCNTRVQGL